VFELVFGEWDILVLNPKAMENGSVVLDFPAQNFISTDARDGILLQDVVDYDGLQSHL
jgi:hypothetical protein